MRLPACICASILDPACAGMTGPLTEIRGYQENSTALSDMSSPAVAGLRLIHEHFGGLDPAPSSRPLCASVNGFSMHAATHVADDDRDALKRLCTQSAHRTGLRCSPTVVCATSSADPGQLPAALPSSPSSRCSSCAVSRPSSPTRRVLEKILTHLRLPATPPTLARGYPSCRVCQ